MNREKGRREEGEDFKREDREGVGNIEGSEKGRVNRKGESEKDSESGHLWDKIKCGVVRTIHNDLDTGVATFQA